jgi:phosphoribosylformimino-5-aminoimidazole carboxamide ribotide isomerase
MIAVSGWTATTSQHIQDFVVSYVKAGFFQVVSTDIGRDGMLNGPAVELYREVLQAVEEQALKIDLIASGGIRSLEDLEILRGMGLSGAIVGKALYEGYIDPKDLSDWQSMKEA